MMIAEEMQKTGVLTLTCHHANSHAQQQQHARIDALLIEPTVAAVALEKKALAGLFIGYD